MGACLTASREFKNRNDDYEENSIQHMNMNRSRKQSIWEAYAAAPIAGEKSTTGSQSDLHSTLRTWESVNLYATQSHFTQSKMEISALAIVLADQNLDSVPVVEPQNHSKEEVQKTFDISTPVVETTDDVSQSSHNFSSEVSIGSLEAMHSFPLRTPLVSHTQHDISWKTDIEEHPDAVLEFFRGKLASEPAEVLALMTSLSAIPGAESVFDAFFKNDKKKISCCRHSSSVIIRTLSGQIGSAI